MSKTSLDRHIEECKSDRQYIADRIEKIEAAFGIYRVTAANPDGGGAYYDDNAVFPWRIGGAGEFAEFMTPEEAEAEAKRWKQVFAEADQWNEMLANENEGV